MADAFAKRNQTGLRGSQPVELCRLISHPLAETDRIHHDQDRHRQRQGENRSSRPLPQRDQRRRRADNRRVRAGQASVSEKIGMQPSRFDRTGDRFECAGDQPADQRGVFITDGQRAPSSQ